MKTSPRRDNNPRAGLFHIDTGAGARSRYRHVIRQRRHVARIPKTLDFATRQAFAHRAAACPSPLTPSLTLIFLAGVRSASRLRDRMSISRLGGTLPCQPEFS